MEDFTNFIINFLDMSGFYFENDQDYLQTLNDSMDTYYEELFRLSNEKICLNLDKNLNQSDNIICKICYEIISKNEYIYILTCNDIFHCDCLENAIKRNHLKCPICSVQLPIRPKTPD